MCSTTLVSRQKLLLKASVAIAFAIAPVHLVLGPTGANLKPAIAFAESGSGHGSGSDSGGDSSGSGSDGSDHSGPGGGHDDGGDDHGGSDNSGAGSGNDDDNGQNNGRNDDRDEHVNATTGVRVEIEGNDIEVEFPDGTKEEIENGRFERKNALGRTIVERPATEADIARLNAFAN